MLLQGSATVGKSMFFFIIIIFFLFVNICEEHWVGMEKHLSISPMSETFLQDNSDKGGQFQWKANLDQKKKKMIKLLQQSGEEIRK